MKIGTSEFIVIFLVLFFVLGPEKTVLYARKLGKWLRTLKVYITSLTGELRETVVEPLQETQETLKDLTKPLESVTATVDKSITELNSATRQLETPVGSALTAKKSKAEEAKAKELAEFAELEVAEMEEAEPEPEELPEAEPVAKEPAGEPAPEAIVDADVEDAGDEKDQPETSPADEISAQETDFKT